MANANDGETIGQLHHNKYSIHFSMLEIEIGIENLLLIYRA